MPRGDRQGGRRGAANIALGGIFSALSLLFLLAGGLVPVGTFVAPIAAGVCLLPIALDVGVKWALLCYVAVSGLGFLLVPDIELMLFFALLLGYYPMLQPTLNKIGSKVLRMAAKLGLFNAAVAVVYTALLLVFTGSALRQELAGRALWFWAILLVAGNITFVLYDTSIKYIVAVYRQRIRPRFFRR